jgi:hypothetical protein
VFTTDTVEIRKPADGDPARGLELWAAVIAAFLAGGLVVAATLGGLQITPTPIGLDLARAAAVGLGVIAVSAWLIHRESDKLVRYIGESTTFNRNAPAIEHEDLRRVIELQAMEIGGLKRATLAASKPLSDEAVRQRGETQVIQQSVNEMAQVVVLHTRVLSEMQRALEATVAEVDARTDNKIGEIMAEVNAVLADHRDLVFLMRRELQLMREHRQQGGHRRSRRQRPAQAQQSTGGTRRPDGGGIDRYLDDAAELLELGRQIERDHPKEPPPDEQLI